MTSASLRNLAPAVAVAALCSGVGALVALSPRLALFVGVLAVPAALLSLGARLALVFHRALVPLLLGYMVLGRGFAHIGVGPVYVGETVLALALLALLFTPTRGKLGGPSLALLAFMALGLARTLPYAAAYGSDAVRDATLWGYGIFAIAVSATLDLERLQRLPAVYRRILPVFLCAVPAVALASHALGSRLLLAPGSDTPLVAFKGGDMGVHLAGAAAFLLLGASAFEPRRRSAGLPLWLLWFAGAAFVASVNRGGLLTIFVGIAVSFTLRPSTGRRVSFAAAAAVAACALVLVNPSVDLGGVQAQRTVSLGQLGLNAISIADRRDPQREGTKTYRLRWWGTIAGYTFAGPNFWGGKGFGVNLADTDGFQTTRDHSLRAPHNTHMTVLARMGVPGLALWILLQAWFGCSLVAAGRRARRRGAAAWAALDGWLLVYWLAMLVDTSFDPYLEGPQGGIWFWSLFGAGLAALRLQRAQTHGDLVEAAA